MVILEKQFQIVAIQDCITKDVKGQKTYKRYTCKDLDNSHFNIDFYTILDFTNQYDIEVNNIYYFVCFLNSKKGQLYLVLKEIKKDGE